MLTPEASRETDRGVWRNVLSDVRVFCFFRQEPVGYVS
jgi:hypothetical protein